MHPTGDEAMMRRMRTSRTNEIAREAPVGMDRQLRTPERETGRLRIAVERLRRFLPASVGDLVVQGDHDTLTSHRRDITVLFLDLRGFTGFTERATPDEVMAVLRDYHRVIGRLVNRHGGTLERFTGDGMMIFFNDPTPVPDPQRRAVAVALAAHARVVALVRGWPESASDLGLGIGISHGSATIGLIGFEDRCDYAAIGMVTNLAARLCARARPGETLVCWRVMSAVGEAVESEALGRIPLAGLRDPVAAFSISRPRSAVARESVGDAVAPGAPVARRSTVVAPAPGSPAAGTLPTDAPAARAPAAS
jgi:adenylate cyclase